MFSLDDIHRPSIDSLSPIAADIVPIVSPSALSFHTLGELLGRLEIIQAACARLAAAIEHDTTSKCGPPEPDRAEPLESGLLYRSLEAVAHGLALAARFGLDLNSIEIGSCFGDDVAAVIRGRSPAPPRKAAA